MKQNRFLITILCLLVISGGCSSPARKQDDSEKVGSPSILKKGAIDVIKKPKIQTTTLFNIDFLFNREQFKRLQSSSHSTALTELPFLFQHGNNGFYMYFYFAKQHRAKHKLISKHDFHLVTAVKKPLDSNDRYLDVEETLVQLQSTIDDPGLGAMDIVNKDTSLLYANFGTPIYRFDEYSIYGGAEHVLVINQEKGIIKGFKYMYLKNPISSFLNGDKSALQDDILDFEVKN